MVKPTKEIKLPKDISNLIARARMAADQGNLEEMRKRLGAAKQWAEDNFAEEKFPDLKSMIYDIELNGVAIVCNKHITSASQSADLGEITLMEKELDSLKQLSIPHYEQYLGEIKQMRQKGYVNATNKTLDKAMGEARKIFDNKGDISQMINFVDRAREYAKISNSYNLKATVEERIKKIENEGYTKATKYLINLSEKNVRNNDCKFFLENMALATDYFKKTKGDKNIGEYLSSVKKEGFNIIYNEVLTNTQSTAENQDRLPFIENAIIAIISGKGCDQDPSLEILKLYYKNFKKK